MLGLIIYLVVTVLAGFILSFFSLTFRSTKKRGDGNPYFVIILVFCFTIFGPFLYVEGVTKMVGKDMEPAIKKAFISSPLRMDKIQYYRVNWYTGSSAKAIVVATEKLGWGGTDRPILSVDLVKEKNYWKAKAFQVVWSDRLNKDNLVMPPYR